MEVKTRIKEKEVDVAIAGVWVLRLVAAGCCCCCSAVPVCVHSRWFTATIADVGGGGCVETSKKRQIADDAIAGGVRVKNGCCWCCWLPLLPLLLLFLLASASAGTPLLLLRCVELS